MLLFLGIGEGGGRLGSLPWLTRGGGSETPQIDTWRRDWAVGLSVLGLLASFLWAFSFKNATSLISSTKPTSFSLHFFYVTIHI